MYSSEMELERAWVTPCISGLLSSIVAVLVLATQTGCESLLGLSEPRVEECGVEGDRDGDEVCDPDDVCAGGDDRQDGDEDGVPDACDACPADAPNDTDGDGVCDTNDVCPQGDDRADMDVDGIPDACDVCALGPCPHCADVLADDPAAPDGVYTIDPDGPGGMGEFDAFCDMTTEGGGWTLVLVASDDNVNTWTMVDRARLTTDTTPIGDVAARHRDFKSPAYHALRFSDLLFVHAPSGVTAEYEVVGDGMTDLGSFIAAIPFPVCDFSLAGNGFPLTGGTLTLGGSLCDTDLYFNLGDHELGLADCLNLGAPSADTTFGPAWSIDNNNGCPFDDPTSASLGLRVQCGGCPPGADATEVSSLGFGGPLGLNTGAVGTAENVLQLYLR